MPIFHFHVRGAVQRVDSDGIELADVNEAWVEALRYAEDLQNEPGSAFRGKRWSVVVDDEAGQFLFKLDVDETT